MGTSALSNPKTTTTGRIPLDLEWLWLKRQRVSAILELSLQPKLHIFVEDILDPNIAWNKLASLYHTNTIADIMVVLNK